MKYKIKVGQQLKMMCIATEEATPLGKKIENRVKLSKKAKENWRIINNFLVNEFTKKVPAGQEYMYRSTNELLRSFDMPDCDGFIYPSIERLKGYNLAIKTFAADRAVEFCGLAYLYNDSYNRVYNSRHIEKRDLFIHQYWSKLIEKEKIIYEPIGPCKIDFHKALDIIEEETEYID